MIRQLRLPSKFLVYLLSLTGGAVAGAFWTFHGDAGIASKGTAFGVIGATKGNHNGATRTTGRGGPRGKSGRGGSYVSEMLMLAAESSTFYFSLEGRNFGFGANRVDIFVNGVQIGSNSDSFNDVSANLGNLAALSHQIAFAGDRSIPQGARQHHNDDEPAFVPPPTSVPPSTSVPDSGGTFLLMLCSGAGLLSMGRLASRQLEK